MKLLIALLFVLPLSVQAGHHKGKKGSHKKSWSYNFFHKNQHYLTVGTALDFSSKKVDGVKTTSYAVQLGRGIIFKQKYDVSFLLNYNKKGNDKSYGLGVDTKYLFHKMLTKYKKTTGHLHPYIGIGFSVDKEDKTTKKVKFSLGNRFPISNNMMLGLDYTYYMGKYTLANQDYKTKGSSITMNWNYFFNFKK